MCNDVRGINPKVESSNVVLLSPFLGVLQHASGTLALKDGLRGLHFRRIKHTKDELICKVQLMCIYVGIQASPANCWREAFFKGLLPRYVGLKFSSPGSRESWKSRIPSYLSDRLIICFDPTLVVDSSFAVGRCKTYIPLASNHKSCPTYLKYFQLP
jgi:hypothetical protein